MREIIQQTLSLHRLRPSFVGGLLLCYVAMLLRDYFGGLRVHLHLDRVGHVLAVGGVDADVINQDLASILDT